MGIKLNICHAYQIQCSRILLITKYVFCYLSFAQSIKNRRQRCTLQKVVIKILEKSINNNLNYILLTNTSTNTLQKISLASANHHHQCAIHSRFARIILRESSDKPARIIHCANHLVTP